MATSSRSTFSTVQTKAMPAQQSETARGDGTPVELSPHPTTSKAWIAGDVADPIALAVLIAAIVLLLKRLRAKNRNPDDTRTKEELGLRLGNQGTKDGATASWTKQFTPAEKPEFVGSGEVMTEAAELPCHDYVQPNQNHELQ